ncbi:hypothetical protein [Methanolobus profundi]|uniref:hypothetical protein n=1 Tax=Methanolobus profundi TaxID=487685 RepID=UPI000B807997|nr:hypothetical protein [Methanolobus profundi]
MQDLVSIDMSERTTEQIQRHIALIQDDMENCCTPCRCTCISEAMQQLYNNHPPAKIQTLLMEFEDRCHRRPNNTFFQALKELLFID